MMEEAGLSEVDLLPLKADGKTRYGDWALPRGWDATRGVLTVQRGGETVVLADYEAEPCSLAMHCSATAPGGVTARAVIADDAETLKNADVRGKIIFTRMGSGAVYAKARDGGAAGIVSDTAAPIPGVRAAEEVIDARRWDNNFQHFEDAGLFCFYLTPRIGAMLRELLAEDPETPLFAEVDARRYDAEIHTVSGLLPGTEYNGGGEETLIFAHAAVRDGRLPRPKRGIRFVMGWECAGSVGFCAAHPDIIARTVCGLVPDMVGSGARSNAVMSVWRNPLSNGSYTDALIDDLFAAYDLYSGCAAPKVNLPFSIGTDNILSDPCFGMPAVSLIMHPALSYHSSLDTMALIEPETLHRNGVVAGAYLLYMANAGVKEAADLSALLDSTDKPETYAGRHAHARAVLSLEQLMTPGRDAPAGWRRVPRRVVPGTLTFDALTDRAALPYKPAWNTPLHLPLFWADGTRSLWQIAALSAAEAGEPDLRAQYGKVTAFFEFLAERGYLTL
jgi:hypothetical protein